MLDSAAINTQNQGSNKRVRGAIFHYFHVCVAQAFSSYLTGDASDCCNLSLPVKLSSFFFHSESFNLMLARSVRPALRFLRRRRNSLLLFPSPLSSFLQLRGNAATRLTGQPGPEVEHHLRNIVAVALQRPLRQHRLVVLDPALPRLSLPDHTGQFPDDQLVPHQGTWTVGLTYFLQFCFASPGFRLKPPFTGGLSPGERWLWLVVLLWGGQSDRNSLLYLATKDDVENFRRELPACSSPGCWPCSSHIASAMSVSCSNFSSVHLSIDAPRATDRCHSFSFTQEFSFSRDFPFYQCEVSKLLSFLESDAGTAE